jgi:cyclase
MRFRIIPVLLLKNRGLYKGIKFKDHKYVGDPINAVKIFNEKEVDELVFLDIEATLEKRKPDIDFLRSIASECFMPLAYGGGINSVDMIREVLNAGIEKVIINSAAVHNPDLIREASRYFGASTIVASVDVKRNLFGKYVVFIHNGKEKTTLNAVEWAKTLANLGAGELIINSIDLDGTLMGYDFDLIKQITSAVSVPVVAAGGGRDVQDFARICLESGASAAAAGARFVFQGKHRAVLITYPTELEILTSIIDFNT